MNMGLLDMLMAATQEAESGAQGEDMHTQLRLSQEVKKLTLPHEMGELFKAIAFCRQLSFNSEKPLSGFANNDQRHRLWTTFKPSSLP